MEVFEMSGDKSVLEMTPYQIACLICSVSMRNWNGFKYLEQKFHNAYFPTVNISVTAGLVKGRWDYRFLFFLVCLIQVIFLAVISCGVLLGTIQLPLQLIGVLISWLVIAFGFLAGSIWPPYSKREKEILKNAAAWMHQVEILYSSCDFSLVIRGYNADDVKSRLRQELVASATSIISLEREIARTDPALYKHVRGLTYKAEEAREKFRERYYSFSSSDLVEERWQSYFDTARSLLDKREHVEKDQEEVQDAVSDNQQYTEQ